uniref:Uncharacterized protein n=1 Tax=Ralstonia syzygii R24 TaxID=907261 RepID=G3AAK3_9RALS|nr:hypothetical protein RALSY_mp30741 [Ralstonia syzygii R24]
MDERALPLRVFNPGNRVLEDSLGRQT